MIAALQHIDSVAAEDPVTARTAVHAVVAGAAVDHVVPAAAEHAIVPGAARDHVIERRAHEPVIAYRAGDRLATGRRRRAPRARPPGTGTPAGAVIWNAATVALWSWCSPAIEALT